MKQLILILIINVVSGAIRYDNYSIVRVFPISEADINTTIDISYQYLLNIIMQNIYFLDLEVPPSIATNVTNDLTDAEVMFNTTVSNIQEFIDKRNEGISEDANINFVKYNKYSAIENFLKSLENKPKIGPSGKGKVVSINEIIGTTEETENKTAKAIYLVKIFKDYPCRGHFRKKKAILIDGGMHAREWISPAFVLYLINQLKNNPSRSLVIEHLVNKFDWYIIPVLNPDGYAYSFETDPWWRKNLKQSVKKKECYGVDINRNFDFMWNPAIGGSDDPCEYQVFAGPKAESEIETKALSDVMRRKGKKGKKRVNFIAYLSVHSYGQLWLYPWGYKKAVLPDARELIIAAKKAAHATEAKFGTKYIVKQASSVFGSTAGGSDDFARGKIGIKYSYTVELPDRGKKGFFLPAEKIKPICEETMEGVIAFAKHIK